MVVDTAADEFRARRNGGVDGLITTLEWCVGCVSESGLCVELVHLRFTHAVRLPAVNRET